MKPMNKLDGEIEEAKDAVDELYQAIHAATMPGTTTTHGAIARFDMQQYQEAYWSHVFLTEFRELILETDKEMRSKHATMKEAILETYALNYTAWLRVLSDAYERTTDLAHGKCRAFIRFLDFAFYFCEELR